MLDIQQAESSGSEEEGDEDKPTDEVEILKRRLQKAGLEKATEKRS